MLRLVCASVVVPLILLRVGTLSHRHQGRIQIDVAGKQEGGNRTQNSSFAGDFIVKQDKVLNGIEIHVVPDELTLAEMASNDKEYSREDDEDEPLSPEELEKMAQRARNMNIKNCPDGLSYNDVFTDPVCEWESEKQDQEHSGEFPRHSKDEVLDNPFGTLDDAAEEVVSNLGEYVITAPTLKSQKTLLPQGKSIRIVEYNKGVAGKVQVRIDGYPKEDFVLESNTDGDLNVLKLGNAPLAWDAKNGLFQLNRLFIGELGKAMRSRKFQGGMAMAAYAKVKGTELEKTFNKSRCRQIVAYCAQVWKDKILPVVTVANLVRTAIAPASTVAMVGSGAAWLGIAAGGWIPVVGWAATGVIIAAQAAAVTWHWNSQGKDARFTTEMLVARARCVRNHIELPASATREHDVREFFKDGLGNVCSEKHQSMLLQVMQRANFAAGKLLEAVEEYGKCLYPADYWNYKTKAEEMYGDEAKGQYAWLTARTRKVNCFAAVHGKLIRIGDKPGLLTMTLSIVAAYGQIFDLVWIEPRYKDLMKTMFGFAPPSHHNLTVIKDLAAAYSEEEKKRRQKEGKEPMEEDERRVIEETTSCMLLLAFNRAYEMTLKRLTVAWKIHAQAYLRNTRHITLRNYPWPCTAFYKMEKGVGKTGFCKQPDLFTISEDIHVRGGPLHDVLRRQERGRVNMSLTENVCAFAQSIPLKRK